MRWCKKTLLNLRLQFKHCSASRASPAGPECVLSRSQQHLGSAGLVIIINKHTENGNLQTRLELLAVPGNQRKKGASARKLVSHWCTDIQPWPLKSPFPWSPSVQKSERGNNAGSIKLLGMVWTKAQETLVHSHTWFCI